MTASRIVKVLLDQQPGIQIPVNEATVHLRGTVWVASFTGPTPGERVWKSTKLKDRQQALGLAKQWEAQARQERRASGHLFRKPIVRVRHPKSGRVAGQFTQREVAQILGMSERGVREVERRAFSKLRRHPLLKKIWQQHLTGELDENTRRLTPAEITALFALTKSRSEVRLIQKLLFTMRS